jgi:NADH:ubiquinone oxidoreductase subunit 4 (subunit M)
LIFLGLMTENTILVFFSALSMITGSIYTLWSFGRIAFGNIKESIYKAKDLERIEFYLYTILVYFLFLLGLFPNSILNIFEYECALIMEQAKIQLMLL